MTPVLTKQQPLPVRDLRRIVGPIALGVIVAALFALLLGLVAAPDTVDHITIENRASTQLEVGVQFGSEPGVLWLATVEPRSTTVVDDVLDDPRDWIVRGEHAGQPAGTLRVSRAELAQRGWSVVIPASWGKQVDKAA
jgi:hypothetical protein